MEFEITLNARCLAYHHILNDICNRCKFANDVCITERLRTVVRYHLGLFSFFSIAKLHLKLVFRFKVGLSLCAHPVGVNINNHRCERFSFSCAPVFMG